MRRRRRKEPPRPRLFALSLGGFLIAVALVLLVSGSLPAVGAAERASSPAARVLKGLETARKAQRALTKENYGDARRYLNQTEDALTSALAELEGIEQ